MTDPLLDTGDQQAREFARRLREQTKQLADAPQREAWWQLREKVKGLTVWRREMQRTLNAAPRDHPLLIGVSAFDAAMREAVATIGQVGRDYDLQAGHGVGSRQRPDAEVPQSSRGFAARFNGTCRACGGPLHRGEMARYDGADQIRHDVCPEPPEPADA